MNSLQSIDLSLSRKLKDKEYREQFFEDWTQDEVALQLRGLRDKRGLRQVDVAAATGMKQSAVSRLEQANYSRWGFPTLLRIAKALDARVKVILEPAEDVIRQYENDEKEIQQGTSVAKARQVEADKARERLCKIPAPSLTTPSIQPHDVVPPPRFSLLHQPSRLGE